MGHREPGPPDPPPLRSHLGDFETTTAELLRPSAARALLNFAALFHEVIYLTDTALGDHQLLIKSFQQDAHAGLFSQVARLIEAGVLRVLCRDKVVVRDKVLVPRDPTIGETFEGWQYRDRVEWAGETGFTTVVDPRLRQAYYREVDALLVHNGAIQRYDPDVPKAAFRKRVRELLDPARPPSMLSKSLAALPRELQQAYAKATQDELFTNAELWRVLRQTPAGQNATILQAHINQQCFADLTESGQCTQNSLGGSLASFNLELQRRRPMALDIDATLEAPDSLDELLERAPVRLDSPGIEMFERLSIEKIVALRRRAAVIFTLARRRVAAHEAEGVRRDYLKALGQYWMTILDTLEAMFPDRMRRPVRAALYAEEQLPTLSRLRQKFRGVSTSLFRVGLSSAIPSAGVLVGPAPEVLRRFGFVLLREPTSEAMVLGGKIPPPEWYPRGILSLDRAASAEKGSHTP